MARRMAGVSNVCVARDLVPRGTANTWLLRRRRKWLPYLDAHGNDVSLRGLRPWTNGDDRPFVHLFAERRSQTKRGELVAKVERSAPRERGIEPCLTFDTAESGRMTPPTDFCKGATRSTKTLSRRGTKRFKPPDMSLPLCLSVALSRSVSLLLAFAARLFAGDFLLEPRAKRLFLKARECVCVCYEESRDDVVVGGFP